MSKIEINEYVRTGDGKIYEHIKDGNDYYYSGPTYFENYLEDIVKHSKQLIDLIEVGDFVNGHRIFCKIHGEIGEKDIKTILTKEQYMANCYKVGGEDEI